jgi:glycerophosphoryl diester phosphodiesterase
MTEVFAHRAIFQNKENSVEGIENNLKLGFNVEIDVRKNDFGIYLSHDPKNEGEELFENTCKIIKNYAKKIAIHVKEDFDIQEIIDLILKYNIEEKCFIFTTSEKKIKTEDVDVAIYQTNNNIPNDTKIFWCDESNGEWYNNKLFLENKKCKNIIITMSRELLMESNFKEIKLDWKRLCRLGVDGICTDFPNELKKFMREQL